MGGERSFRYLFYLVGFGLQLLLQRLATYTRGLQRGAITLFLFELMQEQVFRLFARLFTTTKNRGLVCRGGHVSRVITRVYIYVLRRGQIIVRVTRGHRNGGTLYIVYTIFVCIIGCSRGLNRVLLCTRAGNIRGVKVDILNGRNIKRGLTMLLGVFLMVQLRIKMRDKGTIYRDITIVEQDSIFGDNFQGQGKCFLNLTTSNSIFTMLLRGYLIGLITGQFGITLVGILQIGVIFQHTLVLSIILEGRRARFGTICLGSSFAIVAHVISGHFFNLLVSNCQRHVLFGVFKASGHGTHLNGDAIGALRGGKCDVIWVRRFVCLPGVCVIGYVVEQTLYRWGFLDTCRYIRYIRVF